MRKKHLTKIGIDPHKDFFKNSMYNTDKQINIFKRKKFFYKWINYETYNLTGYWKFNKQKLLNTILISIIILLIITLIIILII